MTRDPETIQREIDEARSALGSALDQIVVRTRPARLVDEGKTTIREFAVSPTGKKVIGGAVAVVAVLAILRRRRTRSA